MRLQEHTLFHDRYRLVKPLGRGGFSEVWLAEDEKANKIKIALKVYAPGAGLDEDGARLFTQEFSLVFNVNHSNLLKPTHFDIYEQMPYLVMPFCNNGSSTRLVAKINEKEAWQFLHDISSGLAYLHAQTPPVIHQDIKPDNVLIDSNGSFLITDFGISTKARSTLRKSVIQSGTSGGGTRAYMGPERFGKEPLPIKASDIWALGATIYELITGDVPFGEHGGVIQKSGAEIPDIQGSWSSDLKKLIALCLNQEPWDRPTAETIAAWSKQKMDGNSIRWSGIRDSGQKKKSKLFIFGVVLGAILSVVGLIVFLNKEPIPPQTIETEVVEYATDQHFYLHGKSFIYNGEIQNGIPHGKGIAKYDDTNEGEEGSIYEGEFHEGYKHGKGSVRDDQGLLYYEGEYFQNKMSGYGKYYFDNGNYYEGEFLNDMFNGKGIKYNSLGKIIQQGIFQNDKFLHN